MKYIVPTFLILLMSLKIHSYALAATLFEDSFENDISSWTTSSGTVTFAKSLSPVFDGSYAVTLTYPSTSSQGIKQSIDITPNSSYKITGQIFPIDATKAFIRVAWYENGNTTQLKTDDSTILTDGDSWTPIDFIVTAPATADRCEIRLLVSSGSAAFDAIQFDEYTQPTETPTQTPTPTQSITATPTPSGTPDQIDYENINISEVMTYPETGEKEWIELQNGNDFQVILTNWYYDDIDGGGSNIRPFSLIIEPHSFGVIELSTAIFNNDGDSVRLLNANQKVKDTVSYLDSQKGLSFGRAETTSELCLQNPTKGVQNENCLADPTITPGITPSETMTPTETPTAAPIQTPAITATPRPTIKGTHTQRSRLKDKELEPPKRKNSEDVVRRDHSTSEGDKTREMHKRISFIAGSYSSLSFISLCIKILLAGKS